ncbi:MAG TPA: C4-type zinc ribbon domain-containing protein [Terriglobales bacterium]|nr:C4-type zinc ribbon domain-containing protein [Terriglobales bacterium]
MLSDLQKLIELQQVDREIQRLQEEVAALPRRVGEIEAKLADTKAQVDKARATIKADETTRRKLESQIQDQQQKISKFRDQSLEVKTNEQYKALMHEIGFAEKEIRRLEDQILEGMLDVDVNEKALKITEAELKAETAEIEKEKAEARKRTAEDEKQLAELNGRREGLRSGINADVLRHYDRVLKFRKSALAEARDHKCSVCQVMLRPQTYNDVRTNEQIIMCDSCQRILYFVPEHEAPPAESADHVQAPAAH